MKPLFMMGGVYYYCYIVYHKLSNERFQFTWLSSPAVSSPYSPGPYECSIRFAVKNVGFGHPGIYCSIDLHFSTYFKENN